MLSPVAKNLIIYLPILVPCEVSSLRRSKELVGEFCEALELENGRTSRDRQKTSRVPGEGVILKGYTSY